MQISALKKYIDLLSELANIRLFVVRYAVNAVVLVELLYLPYVLAPATFVSLEWFRNMLLFIPIVLMGANSGYVNLYYQQEGDFRFGLLISTLFIAFVSSLLVSYIVGDVFFLIAILLYLIIIGVEKILIVDGYLVLASLYKASFSVVLILMAYINGEYLADKLEAAFSISIISGGCFWLLLVLWAYRRNIIKGVCSIRGAYINQFRNEYLALVRAGFFISMQTFVLIAFFLFDRWYILNKYSLYAAEYSISFSLAQVVFIALNTVGYSMQRKLGEGMVGHTRSSIKRLLKINSAFFLMLLLGSLTLIWWVIRLGVFLKYGDFFMSYLCISFFYGLYYLLSTYSVIGLYAGLSKMFMLYILVAFTLNFFVSNVFVLAGVGYYYFVVKSGVILLMLAIGIYTHTLKAIDAK